MEGQDLRQTMVTIGISIVLADLMLWCVRRRFLPSPDAGLAVGTDRAAVRHRGQILGRGGLSDLSDGSAGYLRWRPSSSASLMWLALNRTRIGMIVRAGVDDRDILAAMGVRDPARVRRRVRVWRWPCRTGRRRRRHVSIDLARAKTRAFCSHSLIVVILGGMGSIHRRGARRRHHRALRADGLAYFPTYAIVLTFLIMVLVLALRPQGLLAGR